MNFASRSTARTILIVDARRTNLEILGHRLGKHGYLPILCESGRRAIDLITGGGIDLVLLASDLPDLSCLDVLREVRSVRDTADLPIIVMTSRGDEAGAVEALMAGASDHVARPLGVDMLVARIGRAIGHARRIDDLKRFNAALDARIAARAIELGELRDDRQRLFHSVETLTARLAERAA